MNTEATDTTVAEIAPQATAPESGTPTQLITVVSGLASVALANGLNPENIGDFLDTVMTKLGGNPAPIEQEIEEEEVAPPAKREPVVSVRKSLANPDYIICMLDGRKLKSMKRHLMSHYNMTPEQYRQEFNLPADYPMVAPSYSQSRRDMARRIGLGRKPKAQTEANANADGDTAEAAAPKPRRGRKPKVAETAEA